MTNDTSSFFEGKKENKTAKGRKRSKFLPTIIIVGAVFLLLVLLAKHNDQADLEKSKLWLAKIADTEWIQINTDKPAKITFSKNQMAEITYPDSAPIKEAFTLTEDYRIEFSISGEIADFARYQGERIDGETVNIITTYYITDDGRDAVAYQEFVKNDDYDKVPKHFKSNEAQRNWEIVPTSGGYSDRIPRDDILGIISGSWKASNGDKIFFNKNGMTVNDLPTVLLASHQSSDKNIVDIDSDSKVVKNLQGYTNIKYDGEKITAKKNGETVTITRE